MFVVGEREVRVSRKEGRMNERMKERAEDDRLMCTYLSKVSTFLTRKAVSIDVVQPAGLLRALGHPLVVMVPA